MNIDLNVNRGAADQGKVLATFDLASAGFTLAGAGRVEGNLNLAEGRIVSSNGTLNISGDLTLSGGVTEFTVGTSTGTIVVTGTASLGGALKVNMKGALLTGTRTNVLLTAGSVTGNFTSVILPTPPVGTTYRAAVVDGQVVLNVTPATPAEKWMVSKGLTVDTPLSQDGDGDGWCLLQEYVLGGDPVLSDGAMISMGVPSNTFQVSFSYNTNANDVAMDIASSSNLTLWTTILTKTNGSATWSGPATFTKGSASAVSHA